MSVQVHNALNQHFNDRLDWQLLSTQGTSHRIFCARDSQGHIWVARINAYQHPAPGISFNRELNLLEQLSCCSWIPTVEFVDQVLGVLVTPWAGEVYPPDSYSESMQAEISKLVSKLHRLSPSATMSYAELFDQYRCAFGESETGLQQLVDDTERLLVELPDIGECLVHHDLHSANLCWSDKLTLIDWEYAGVGNNPWIDYASLARDLGFSLKQLKAFPRLAELPDAEISVALAQAIEFLDQLDQIWSHYRATFETA